MPWEYNGNEDQGGGGYGPQPPDLDEVLRKIKARFGGVKIAGKLPGGAGLVLLFIIIGWLATGFYIIGPDEVGVVKRFGKVTYTTKPGPHWHLPVPIEEVLKPRVTQVKRLEIGFRTISPGPPARYQEITSESMMLTGDENIVNAQFIVQYRIKDPVAYLFNIANQTETVRDATEAAMREIVGKTLIDEVLTVGKFRIQQEAMVLLQSILDRYQAGVDIVAVQLQDVHPPKAVIEAFKDVASAKENKIKVINESEGYRNDILPKAKGKASQMINEAQAAREEMINYAKGDAARFLSNLKGYQQAPSVTRKRMYLETMEEVLAGVDKIILDEKMGKGMLPLLPIDPLRFKGQSAE
ncbi:MAG: FtsH protease activity modulator HflK [Deltaproteobacteria bacterium]|nr:FtsH protease activity modulator HflK [Candidatus Anaeroferrophillus wilburensis]MBN2888057.1 FtsH protease activity modulator HflK [Deltaproteobacteria bacterium]